MNVTSSSKPLPHDTREHSLTSHSTTCTDPCADDGCTALGPVKHSDEFMFDLSTVGWGDAVVSFQCCVSGL